MRGDKRPARNAGLTDDQIIAHAVENGWTMHVNDRAVFTYGPTSPGWTGWRLGLAGGSQGIPVNPDEPRVRNQWNDDAGRMIVTAVPCGWADVMRSRLDHTERCAECGRWIEYNHSHDDPVLREGPWTYCSGCRFWLDRITMIEQGKVTGYASGRPGSDRPFIAVSSLGDVRPEGATFFSIGTARTPSSHNGFSGSWFVVTFPDGTKVETCDLWCGGRVPDRFRDRMPVTATLRYGRLVTP